ncbi:MAG TPA: hypothetical protein ENI44_01400, partial [Thermoplasmatales archaeon]|nr:hypothetical protein [Thermoplasmatales archaeon]
MWLSKIVVKNFKPYRDETFIGFGFPSANKHITIIYGDNGFGKTSLLDAVYWGLYGKLSRDPYLMFNDNPSDDEMFVELHFYDDEYNEKIIVHRSV